MISRAKDACPSYFEAMKGRLSDYRAKMEPDGQWRIWKYGDEGYIYSDKEHPLSQCSEVAVFH